MLVFIGALSVNLARGNPVNCGCFDVKAKDKPRAELLSDMRWTILRDVGMLVLAAQVLSANRRQRRLRADPLGARRSCHAIAVASRSGRRCDGAARRGGALRRRTASGAGRGRPSRVSSAPVVAAIRKIAQLATVEIQVSDVVRYEEVETYFVFDFPKSATLRLRGRVLGGFDLSSRESRFDIQSDSKRGSWCGCRVRGCSRSIHASSGSTRRAGGSTRSRPRTATAGCSGRAASSGGPPATPASTPWPPCTPGSSSAPPPRRWDGPRRGAVEGKSSLRAPRRRPYRPG